VGPAGNRGELRSVNSNPSPDQKLILSSGVSPEADLGSLLWRKGRGAGGGDLREAGGSLTMSLPSRTRMHLHSRVMQKALHQKITIGKVLKRPETQERKIGGKERGTFYEGEESECAIQGGKIQRSPAK